MYYVYVLKSHISLPSEIRYPSAIQVMGIKIPLYQGTRHSSASEAVNRVGMDMVQHFLGHTRQEMTQKYAKMNPKGLKPVLREK